LPFHLKIKPFPGIQQYINRGISQQQGSEPLKGSEPCLSKENLQDNMTNTEMILNMLAETTTKDISQSANPETFEESAKVAQRGGNVDRVARLELEVQTGKKVVTSLNARAALKGKDSPQLTGKSKPGKNNPEYTL
jgi:hypothetical protein